jgi:hypothetical protein
LLQIPHQLIKNKKMAPEPVVLETGTATAEPAAGALEQSKQMARHHNWSLANCT